MIFLFVLVYYVDILLSGVISFDGLVKNLVLLFIFTFGLNIPTEQIKRVLRVVLFINVLVTIINYLSPQIIPLGQVYQTTYFLERNVNTGIFFELNYSAMFTIASAFYLYNDNKIKLIAILLFAYCFYTFRSSIFFVPFLFMGNVKAFNKLYFVILVLLFLYIYDNYGFLLEQRYYIWKSFFYTYDFQIEKLSDFQNRMKEIMEQSPWGYSGLNLHNGIFESFIARGFYSTIIIYGYIVIILFNSVDVFKQKVISVFLILSIFMSLAVGGLNILSLLFTILIFNRGNKYDYTYRLKWGNRSSSVQ